MLAKERVLRAWATTLIYGLIMILPDNGEHASQPAWPWLTWETLIGLPLIYLATGLLVSAAATRVKRVKIDEYRARRQREEDQALRIATGGRR